MPPRDTNGTEVSADDLSDLLDREAPFFLLDVRNREDFAAWRVEGRRPIPAHNVPYFEMLEEGGKDDVVDAAVSYVENRLGAVLPKGERILAVCAKGETSAYVAEGLRRLGYDAANLGGGMAAWGNHYTARAAVEERGLAIHQIARPARGCLSYVVASEGRAALVDPLRHAARYLEFARARDLRIDAVLDTHGHADHVSGGPAIARAAGAPYHLHPYDAIHPIDVLPARIPFEPLRGGQEIAVGGARIRAFHIPGHTLGNVAFLVNDRFLLSGDSIFLAAVSRPDLGGRGEAWAPLHYRSLRALLDLPDETLVLPGHFTAPSEARADGVFAAPLGRLRAENEGLRAVAEGEKRFTAYVLASLPHFPPQYVEIKRVNIGLSEPGEEDLSELELGKNVCALSGAAA
jgi:glyoxylase-like metal-dependent hydrolase (beta-lactamase superfamily II)/rhodanese-related sulfurtransferase